MENWSSEHGKVRLRSGDAPTVAAANSAFASAIAAFRQGQLNVARDAALKLLEEHPDYASAWHLLGQIARTRGDAAVAVKCLKEAVRSAPGNYALHNDLGLALQSRGRYRQALTALERAHELAPERVEPVLNCANVLVRLDRIEEAIERYRQALRLVPDHLPTLTNLAALFESDGRLKAASQAVKKALELSPNSASVQLIAAKLERRAGLHDKAIRRLMVHLRPELTDKQQALMHREIGLSLDEKGEFEGAIQAFKRANGILERLARGNHSRTHLPQRLAETRAVVAAQAAVPSLTRADADRIPPPVFVVGSPGAGAHRLAAMLHATDELNVGVERDIWRQIRHLKERALADGERDLAAIQHDLRAHYLEHSPGTDTGPFVEVATLGITDFDLWHELFPDARVLRVVRDADDAMLNALVQLYAENDTSVLLLRPADAKKLDAAIHELWVHAISALDLLTFCVQYTDLYKFDADVFAQIGMFICDDLLPLSTKLNSRVDDDSMFVPNHARNYRQWLHA